MKEPWAWNRSQSNFSCWWASRSSGQWSKVHLDKCYQDVTWATGWSQGKSSLMAVFATISWWAGLSAASGSFILYFLKIKIASDLWVNLLPVSCVGDSVLHSDKKLGPKLLLFFMGGSNVCLWLNSGAWADCEPTVFSGALAFTGLFTPPL